MRLIYRTMLKIFFNEDLHFLISNWLSFGPPEYNVKALLLDPYQLVWYTLPGAFLGNSPA